MHNYKLNSTNRGGVDRVDTRHAAAKSESGVTLRRLVRRRSASSSDSPVGFSTSGTISLTLTAPTLAESASDGAARLDKRRENVKRMSLDIINRNPYDETLKTGGVCGKSGTGTPHHTSSDELRPGGVAGYQGNTSGPAVKPGPKTQFGVSLQHIKHYNSGSVICPVVEHSARYLRDCCLDADGLFRLSCKFSLMREIQDKYNRGESVDFRELANPHLPAAILKLYFRELPEPVLTFELYNAVVENHSFPVNQRIAKATELVCKHLPEDNYKLLSFFVKLLTEVSAHSSKNKMDAMNLGIVTAPSLLWARHGAGTQAAMSASTQIGSFIQLMVEHYDKIFIR